MEINKNKANYTSNFISYRDKMFNKAIRNLIDHLPRFKLSRLTGYFVSCYFFFIFANKH